MFSSGTIHFLALRFVAGLAVLMLFINNIKIQKEDEQRKDRAAKVVEDSKNANKEV